MRIETVRWLLAPARQWRTRRLIRQHGPTLPYATAWSLITLARHAREFGYVRAAHAAGHRLPEDREAGVYQDDWSLLGLGEQARRHAWLRRHAASPIQLLGLDPRTVRAAGLHVVDWGIPAPEPPAEPASSDPRCG